MRNFDNKERTKFPREEFQLLAADLHSREASKAFSYRVWKFWGSKVHWLSFLKWAIFVIEATLCLVFLFLLGKCAYFVRWKIPRGKGKYVLETIYTSIRLLGTLIYCADFSSYFLFFLLSPEYETTILVSTNMIKGFYVLFETFRLWFFFWNIWSILTWKIVMWYYRYLENIKMTLKC